MTTYQWSVRNSDLDPTFGHEQSGQRPILVVSAEPLNELYGVVMVAPLTSRKNNRLARVGEVLLPAGSGGLRSDSFVLCYQIRALDKSRLGPAYGSITDATQRDLIRETIASCLDLD
ncbi:MAG: type II toxin-antitoxin system PemK/MazF family toxin [Capsulimonadaceae bacterium]